MAADITQDRSFGPLLPGQPDFTIGFETIVFVMVPAALLILITPFFVADLIKKQPAIRPGLLLLCKMIIAVCLLSAELANIVFWNQSPVFCKDIGITAASLALASALCINIMVYAEHVYSLQPSTLISVYLSVTLLFDVARTRTYFLREGFHSIGGLSIALMVLKAAVLLLEEVSKRGLVRDAADRFVNNETFSGFWNRALFLWLNSSLVLGFRTVLDSNDLQDIPPEFRTEHASNKFMQAWNRNRRAAKFGLIQACMAALGSKAYFVIIPRLCYLALSYTQPFLIRETVIAVGERTLRPGIVGGIIAGFALLYFVLAITQNFSQHLINRKITLLRGYLISAVYRKVLKLDRDVLKQSAALTLISADIAGVELAAGDVHDIWSAIAGVGAGMYVLTIFIGGGAAMVVIPICLTTLASTYLSFKMKSARERWNERIERRVASTSDALEQMKSIKMSGLAEVVADQLQDKLEAEVKTAKESRRISALVVGLSEAAEMLTPIVVVASGLFWTRSSTGFTIPDIFASLSVVAIIADPLYMLVTSSSGLSAALGCFQRLQEFLTGDELVDSRENPKTHLKRGSTRAEKQLYESSLFGVSLVGVCTARLRDGRQILRDITVKFLAQKLSMIIGPVGCGKSTLLKAIIGEIMTIEGHIYIDKESIAYCDQTPWLQNKTIQRNIVGENPYSRMMYEAVLYACCLLEDLCELPDGDNTVVGSGGCNLSGGQKQRIAVARALYANRPILVLDDVFSGLDKRTAATIFRRLFGPEGVLRTSHTTVIMTTNLQEHLPMADAVYRLEEHGPIRQLSVTDSLLQENYLKHESELTDEDEIYSMTEKDPRAEQIEAPQIDAENDEQAAVERQHGDLSLYWYYIKSFSITRLVIWIIWAAVMSAMERIPIVFIRIWMAVDPTNKVYFAGYAGCGVATVIAAMAFASFFFLSLMVVSYKKLHWIMLNRVMRFSQDMSLIGQDLPMIFFRAVVTFFTVVVDIAIISSGPPYAPAIIPVFLLFFYSLQHFYLRTSRQLRHLDLEAKTPVVTLFSESSSGIQHIRPFGWINTYMHRAFELIDRSQKTFYNMLCIQQWLRLVLDLAVMVIATIVVSLALCLRSAASQAGVGLALINLISFSQAMSRHLNEWVAMETSLGAVARLKSFVETTPIETKETPSTAQIEELANWPSAGHVEFSRVSAKYNEEDRNAPRALDNVTFEVLPRQKVGICGRTGRSSGKTSLMLAFLQLLKYSGSITIDGVELKDVPHTLLRSRITTIPQDAVELDGSVRFNLYPYKDGTKLLIP